MKTKEEILMKHFEKEYGFKVPENRIAGFKYVYDAMDEFARQEHAGEDLTRSESEDAMPEIENHPDNPRLRNHKHIPFHGGWITFRGRGEPSEKQMEALEELYKLAMALDPKYLKDEK